MKRIENVSEALIRSIEIPERTQTYIPIPNADVIDMIKHTMQHNKFDYVNATYRVTNDRGVVSGLLNFKGNIDELGMSVGFTNSYNKQKALKIGIGSVVWVCTNGMLSADFSIIRKHTGSIDVELPDIINELAELTFEEHNKNILQRNEMLNRLVTERERAEYYGMLFFKEKTLNSMQANGLLKKIEKQKQLENEDGYVATLWDTYQNVTEVLKESHPDVIIDDHINLNEITRNLFKLTV